MCGDAIKGLPSSSLQRTLSYTEGSRSSVPQRFPTESHQAWPMERRAQGRVFLPPNLFSPSN